MNNFLIKNKYKILIFVFALIFSFSITPIYAANFFTNSSIINVNKGDIVAVKIFINSENVKNYTFKSSVKFSSDVLNVTDWKWADNWMPVVQDDYDSLNNSLGVIVRTAGYPEGVSGVKEFGTITFVAEKTGQAIISFDKANSFILNADSENTYNR